MRKLLYLALLILPLASNAQWISGGTPQTILSGNKQLRFNFGASGFVYGYTKGQIDSLFGVGHGVTSFNTRTGAVVPLVGDYSSFYPQLTGSYSNPSWITSLAWSKITGTPTTLGGYGIVNAYPKTHTDSIVTGLIPLTGYVTVNQPVKTVGDVLNENFAHSALPSGWAQSLASATITYPSSSYLHVTGGNGTVNNSIEYSTSFNSGKFTIIGSFVPQSNSTGDAIGLGMRSVVGANLAGIYCKVNLGTTGLASFGIYTDAAYTSSISTSQNLPFSIGDNLMVLLEANYSYYKYTLLDVTTGASVSTNYNYSFASFFPTIPNLGNLRYTFFQGTQDVKLAEIKDNTQYKGNLIWLGDSITDGYKGSTETNGYASLVFGNNRLYYDYSAGAGETSANALLRVNQIIAAKPKSVGILLGANDALNGVSASTFQTNLTSIVTSLQAAGIVVYLSTLVPNTTASVTAYNTAVQAVGTAKGCVVVDIFTPLSGGSGTRMLTQYDSGDGTHPNNSGMALMAKTWISTVPSILINTNYPSVVINRIPTRATAEDFLNVDSVGNIYKVKLAYVNPFTYKDNSNTIITNPINNLQLGTASTTFTTSATPNYLDMGSVINNTPNDPGNAKLKIANDGTSSHVAGFSYSSANGLETYTGSTNKMTLFGLGVFPSIGGAVTASAGLGIGNTFIPSITASANGDALVGVNIAPTYNQGAFTGVTNYAIRSSGTGGMLVNGYWALGTSLNSTVLLNVTKALTGGVSMFGVNLNTAVQSDVTTSASYFNSSGSTAAASFTLPTMKLYSAVFSNLGAGSAITNLYGYYADGTLIQATNNYGFYHNIASGTGRWGFYGNGTAVNYLNGNLQLGSTTATTGAEKLQVTGAASISSIANGASAGAFLSTTTAGGGAIQYRTPAQVASDISASLAANPTATAGKAAVNGSAATLMRSDAAPKIDSTSTGFVTRSGLGLYAALNQNVSPQGANGIWMGGDIKAGTTTSNTAIGNSGLAFTSTLGNGSINVASAGLTLSSTAGFINLINAGVITFHTEAANNYFTSNLKVPTLTITATLTAATPVTDSLLVSEGNNVKKIAPLNRVISRTIVADANYTQLSTDYLIAYSSLTAARTVTLIAISNNQIIKIKDQSGQAGAFNLTIAAPAGKTIDGATTKTIATNYAGVSLYYDSTSGNYFTQP